MFVSSASKVKTKARLRPSQQLKELVRVQGGICRSSAAWGVHYMSLRRFLKYGEGISGNTVAALIKVTGLKFGTLFVIE